MPLGRTAAVAAKHPLRVSAATWTLRPARCIAIEWPVARRRGQGTLGLLWNDTAAHGPSSGILKKGFLMHIRPEQPNDSAAIEVVTIAAFAQAPHSDQTEHFIVRALRAAGVLAVSLVAEEGGKVVGHVAVSPVQISDGTPGWYGLGPISVVPERQGQGVGTQLMHAALQALRALGARGCVVLGDPAFYGRLGFVAEPALQYPGVSPMYFQALAWGAPLPRGTVAYHAAFAAQG